MISLKTLQSGISRLLAAAGFAVPNGAGADMATLGVTAANPQYTPKKSILFQQSGPNHSFQVDGSTPFKVAYFYGVFDAAPDGTGYSANNGSIFVGEVDPDTGDVYGVDEVTNVPSAPVKYAAPEGQCWDLKDFIVYIPTGGDGVLIKYS